MKLLLIIYHLIAQVTIIYAANQYLGCFIDQIGDRDLSIFIGDYEQLTPKQCLLACRAQNLPYAAIQYGNECRCGQQYGKYGQTSEKECDYLCVTAEKCGGDYRNSVYKVVDSMDQSHADPSLLFEKLIRVKRADAINDSTQATDISSVSTTLTASTTRNTGSSAPMTSQPLMTTNPTNNVSTAVHSSIEMSSVPSSTLVPSSSTREISITTSHLSINVTSTVRDTSMLTTTILSSTGSNSVSQSSINPSTNTMSSVQTNSINSSPAVSSTSHTDTSGVVTNTATTASSQSSAHTDTIISTNPITSIPLSSTTAPNILTTILTTTHTDTIQSTLSSYMTQSSSNTAINTASSLISTMISVPTSSAFISTVSPTFNPLSSNSITSNNPSSLAPMMTTDSPTASSITSTYSSQVIVTVSGSSSFTSSIPSASSSSINSVARDSTTIERQTAIASRLATAITVETSVTTTTVSTTATTTTVSTTATTTTVSTTGTTTTVSTTATTTTVSTTGTTTTVSTTATTTTVSTTGTTTTVSTTATTTTVSTTATTTTVSTTATTTTMSTTTTTASTTATTTTVSTTTTTTVTTATTTTVTTTTTTTVTTATTTTVTTATTTTTVSTTTIPLTYAIFTIITVPSTTSFNPNDNATQESIRTGLSNVINLAFRCLIDSSYPNCTQSRQRVKRQLCSSGYNVDLISINEIASTSSNRRFLTETTVRNPCNQNAMISAAQVRTATDRLSSTTIRNILGYDYEGDLVRSDTIGTTDSPTTDRKLWLIGAILGPIAFALLLIFIFCYLHYKCRPRPINRTLTKVLSNAPIASPRALDSETVAREKPVVEKDLHVLAQKDPLVGASLPPRRLTPIQTERNTTDRSEHPVTSEIPMAEIRRQNDVERWRNKLRLQEKFQKSSVPNTNRSEPYQYDTRTFEHDPSNINIQPANEMISDHSPYPTPKSVEIEAGRTKLHRLLDEVLDRADTEEVYNPDSDIERQRRRRQRRRINSISTDPRSLSSTEQIPHLPVIPQVYERPDPTLVSLRYNPYEAGDRAHDIARLPRVELKPKYPNDDQRSQPYSSRSNPPLFFDDATIPDRAATATDAYANPKRFGKTRVETDQEAAMRHDGGRVDRRQHKFNDDAVYIDTMPKNQDGYRVQARTVWVEPDTDHDSFGNSNYHMAKRSVANTRNLISSIHNELQHISGTTSGDYHA